MNKMNILSPASIQMALAKMKTISVSKKRFQLKRKSRKIFRIKKNKEYLQIFLKQKSKNKKNLK